LYSSERAKNSNSPENENNATSYSCSYQSWINVICSLYWGAAQWTAVPAWHNGTCTRSTETGVSAKDHCYDRTWSHLHWDGLWSRIGVRMLSFIFVFQVLHFPVFSAHLVASTRRGELLLSTAVCLSVRPSVCLSNACIVTKRNNSLSIFQHHTTHHRCF